jgi:flagellar biosynthesis/type III secretory pathway M-ring protein FliF/YscJ
MPTDMMRSERGPALLANQLLGLWGRQSRGRQLLAVLALVAVVMAIGWAALQERAERWAVVVTARHEEEAHECIAALQRRGIAVRAVGRDVEVAPGDVTRALEALVEAGLPDSGVGLRSFDEGGLLASGFAEQVSYKRALQDELARSIKGLAPVDVARVHLALGHRSLFKDRDQRPSASVALRQRPGYPISAAQVRGIQQLVVGSVEGLRAEEVAVIDHLGNVLQGEVELAGGSQAQIEQAVAAKVRGILERVVGAGNVVVVVSADVERRKLEEKAGGSEPGGATQPGGATEPGAATIATEMGAGPRLQLAVVVDYHRDGKGNLVAPGPAELARWTQLARSAAGLDEARGDRLELQAAPFVMARPEPGLSAPVPVELEPRGSHQALPRWAIVGGGVAVALLAIAAVSAAMRRRQLARRLEESERRGAALSQEILASERRTAEAQAALRMAQPEGGRRPTADRVTEVVRRDLDSAALVLSAWLAEAEGEGERRAGGAGEAEGGLS